MTPVPRDTQIFAKELGLSLAEEFPGVWVLRSRDQSAAPIGHAAASLEAVEHFLYGFMWGTRAGRTAA